MDEYKRKDEKEQEKEKNFWKRLKKKNEVAEEGVVGDWNLVTKLLLKCVPYEVVKRIIECILEHNFQKKELTYINAKKQKVLTSGNIYEAIVGKCTLKKAEEIRIFNSLKEEHKKHIKSYWDKKYAFIEKWTRMSLLLAILAAVFLFFFAYPEWKSVILGIAVLGLFRVFEIMLRQIRTVLFDTLGQNAVTLRSPRRSIILLIYNVIEMIFWFACSFMAIYLVVPGNGISSHLSEKFEFGQFIMSSTLQFLVYGDGYTILGQNTIGNHWLMTITFWEILVGFIVTLVAFARLFSLLPNVVSQDEK